MSFAVIQTGGKQYKVKAGEIIKVEKLLDSKPETKVEFKEILAYDDGKNLEIGSPTISGAKVEAEIIKNGKCIKVGQEFRTEKEHEQNHDDFIIIDIDVADIFNKIGITILPKCKELFSYNSNLNSLPELPKCRDLKLKGNPKLLALRLSLSKIDNTNPLS